MRRRFLQGLLVAPWALAGCDFSGHSLFEAGATDESRARRERTEKRLKAEGVPLSTSLGVIADSKQALRRPVDVVAGRALSLLIVGAKGDSVGQDEIMALVRDCGVDADLSPNERKFVDEPSPDPPWRADLWWGYESGWALLWALGYVPDLGRPEHRVDIGAANTILKGARRADFVEGARLRPIGEILDAADLIYRYHWAVVEMRVKKRPPVPGLDADVVFERHKAPNWLIGYKNQAWDDVKTDT